jgi:predicted phosphodiesterase
MHARLALLFSLVSILSCETGSEGPNHTSNSPDSLSPDKACAHDICTAGAKLAKTCDPCVKQICAAGADPYCCSTKWDDQCVGEVASICGITCGGTSSGATGGTNSGTTGGTNSGTTGGTNGTNGGNGGTNNGTTGGTGGSLLNFAVFGDCRPPNLEGTKNYPSAIIGGIFSLAQQHNAQFMIGTGDYMFSNTSTGVNAQVALFKQARANYAGPTYLTMGNHECNGFTASNCPLHNETPNVQTFMTLLPSGVNTPYYRIDYDTPLGKAKFLFVAANAWDSTQQSWLQTQLADPTTYTFVMRHEPPADTSAPGVSPSESLIQSSSYTLELLGHTHEYKHIDTQHVISGNAGAPLQPGSGSTYGLLMVQQQQNGNITVTEIDEATGNVTDTWTVSPNGQAQ